MRSGRTAAKAYPQLKGTAGPAFNKDGGTQIGNTGLWVADYTMQPENGGVSVFAHEYAHDLGLPDEYDTAAATGTRRTRSTGGRSWPRAAVGAGEPGSAPAPPTSVPGTSSSSAGSTMR